MFLIKFFLFAVMLPIIYIFIVYNYIAYIIEKVKKNQANIAVELDRRFKVFESLVNINFRYLNQKKSFAKELYYIKNLKKNQEKDNIGNMSLGQEKIDSDRDYLVYICGLQEEMVKAENRLAEAKKIFNKSVQSHKYAKNLLFSSLIISNLNPCLDAEFIYWDLNKEEKLEKENYSIHL